jgi:hypothetical protein
MHPFTQDARSGSDKEALKALANGKAEILREAGAAVDLRICAPAPHEVHPEEVDARRALVRSVTADTVRGAVD